MSDLIYAGIGSRKTPTDILDQMQELAVILSEHGYVLSSGHAPGADQAFEKGATNANIHLPWATFQMTDKLPKLHKVWNGPTIEAEKTVNKYHPNPRFLSKGGKLLHARNAHIILGRNLETPVDFVICWTENAKGGGGTGQAIRIAHAHNIPVYDLARESTQKLFGTTVRRHYSEDIPLKNLKYLHAIPKTTLSSMSIAT